MKLTEDEIITTIWFVVSIAILAVHSVCGRLVTWKSWPVALEFGRVRQAGRQRTMTVDSFALATQALELMSSGTQELSGSVQLLSASRHSGAFLSVLTLLPIGVIKTLKILFLTFKTCTRAAKEASALAYAGHEVVFLQCHATSQEILLQQGTCVFYSSPSDLGRKLPAFQDFDIIHVHNEPNFMVRVVHETMFNPPPVVLDCHDLNAMRIGQADDDERYAVEKADALIFPSKGYYDGATEFFSLPDEKPKIVLFSMPNYRHIEAITELPKVRGIVYQGAAVADVMGAPPIPDYLEHRKYLPLSDAMLKMGIPFHMYGVLDLFISAYIQSGAICHGMYPYSLLLNELTRYDWGFCGATVDTPQWHNAMPNKMFDYIAAGIPVLVHKADECASFVERHGVGVKVDHLMDIHEVYDRHKELKANVLKMREQFVMEMQMPKLIKLYEQVLNAKSKQ